MKEEREWLVPDVGLKSIYHVLIQFVEKNNGYIKLQYTIDYEG